MYVYIKLSWDKSEQKACQRHATNMPRKAAGKSEQQASTPGQIPIRMSWGKSEQRACQRHVASMHVEPAHPVLHVRRTVKTAATLLRWRCYFSETPATSAKGIIMSISSLTPQHPNAGWIKSDSKESMANGTSRTAWPPRPDGIIIWSAALPDQTTTSAAASGGLAHADCHYAPCASWKPC